MSLTMSSGDKGGVGKSFVIKGYLDFLLTAGNDQVVVVEADTTNPDIYRLFRDHLPVECLDLKLHDGWMQLIDLLSENMDKEMVVSLPAGINHFIDAEADFLLPVLKELNHSLRVFWTINRDKDSIILLKDFLNNPLADYATEIIVVMNGYFGEQNRFFRWNESKTRKDFLARKGCREAFLPELHERVVDAVSGPYCLSEGLKYSVKIELQRWLRDARAALATGGTV